MVVARAYGGLGNQMFQYAAALAVADRLGTGTAVDAAWFRSVGPQAGRSYGLDAFGIEPGVPLRERLRHRLRPPLVVREVDGDDPRKVDDPRRGVVLDGYWQSERLFTAAAPRVREAFRFRGPDPPLVAELRRSESVSIHVRRGDYLAPKRAARLGVLSPQYYERALALVSERVVEPRFVVFSDDDAWCREQFAGDGRVEVLPANERAPHEDLRLMAACRHHLVANSSFSWWGAWLGEETDTVVVAPAQWYRDPATGRGDTVPDRWLRAEPAWL